MLVRLTSLLLTLVLSVAVALPARVLYRCGWMNEGLSQHPCCAGRNADAADQADAADGAGPTLSSVCCQPVDVPALQVQAVVPHPSAPPPVPLAMSLPVEGAPAPVFVPRVKSQIRQRGSPHFDRLASPRPLLRI